ncbi:sigma 54-interacting transcriptional regulator [Fusibacter paucivorans]|uniref:Sigma 54-interacting transcriptional regulator n=1 Tax=Fusibacter paucivorans TaxID=76009 RepID=A0ABS5PJA5_9FIRM|nr:sigma 54-interacting transcriptional regulator [Fusibacter paucivorans]MBS7525170.1 sigma 54-interacting transcriptional regulator [Fusibacter paucivorans]
MKRLTTFDLFQKGFILEVLDSANDGVNIVDIDGNIVYANRMSADYADTTRAAMVGKHISLFYEDAVLLKVLKTRKPILDQQIHYIGNKKYMVNSYPIFLESEFAGAYSIFKDIRDIETLNKRISYLELHLEINQSQHYNMDIIGGADSLKNVLTKAKRTVGSLGGPRHSIISGESGTGKTMLANLIFQYAKQVGVIKADAPLIEVNCAQFTNPDIAAVEIFGSEVGAYTGSKEKRGLFEQANGGILFLDEAHALGHYQNLLLKVMESGKIRRIGGHKEIQVDVIIIAASTRDLKTVLLPELYQRLAQYEISMPSLDSRSMEEKRLLLRHFVRLYEKAVEKIHGIQYSVYFSEAAEKLLLEARYPRNIRQFRDVINFSIDAASPLIDDVKAMDHITTYVEVYHIPFEIVTPVETEVPPLAFNGSRQEPSIGEHQTDDQTHVGYIPGQNAESLRTRKTRSAEAMRHYILQLNDEGLGPRRIANMLTAQGYNIAYYQVAYILKKHREDGERSKDA